MLTQKLNINKKNSAYGFVSWSKDSQIQQKEIRTLLSMGRDSENLIPLNDDYTSRRHCRIQKNNNEEFLLLDMNSRNGTFLNGNRVYKALLKNNDRIQVGKTEFTFSFERLDHDWNIHTQSQNSQWKEQLNSLPNISKNDMPVLITGPSGTGKEMLAQLIHRYSDRSKGPMVSINCSALSESLIESEFFGHLKGSYTGALTTRKGAFIAAEKGSLFLDEIGDLPLHLQPKLLRAIEYQEIKAVGSDQTTKTNVRIIAATHQNLQQKIAEKTFRADLYFRLNVLNISLPALNERMEDFDLLLKFFCAKYNTEFSTESIQVLKQQNWPGNIRELKNTIARARALHPDTVIEVDKLKKLLFSSSRTVPPTPISLTENNNIINTQTFSDNNKPTSIIKKMEREMITKCLSTYKGNQKKVSEQLGIPRSTLSDRLKKYKINSKSFK